MKEFFKRAFKSIIVDIGIVFLIIVGIGIYLLFNPELVSAQQYQPLAPIPGFSDSQSIQQNGTDLSTYVGSIYNLSIGIGVVLAILMLVISGFEYAATDVFVKKTASRNRMTGAILGLLLLLGSYLLLNTINSDLVKLDDVDIESVVATSTEPSPQQVISYEDTFARNGITTESDIDQHFQNIEDGFKRAEVRCANRRVDTRIEGEAEKQRRSALYVCNVEKEAREERRTDREYRSCVIRETAGNQYNAPEVLIEACYYFRNR